MVESAILRWTGHVTRMGDERIPKRLLYGRLKTGRSRQGNHATYLNQVRGILRACDIKPDQLENLAENRVNWRATYKAGVAKAEDSRISHLIAKRERRKARTAHTHQPT